jgi:FSR family fosmidomycin resistance protein-like MFS transporter
MNTSTSSTPAKLSAAGGTTVIAVMTASHFINDNFTSLLTPLGPAIAERFQVTLADTGTLVAVLSLVGSVSQPLFGALGDRVDRRWLAAAGPVLAAVGMTLMGYAPTFFALALLIILGGIGSAVFHPSGAAYVAANSNLERRGLYASIFSAGGTAGLALGPLTATALGLNGIVWLMPLGLLMGVVSYALTPSSRSASGKAVGLKDYLETFSGPIRTLWGISVLRSLSTVTYGSLIPFVAADNPQQWQFQLFMPRFAFESGVFTFQLDIVQISNSYSVAVALFLLSIAAALGGIAGGQISDRIGRTKVLRSSVGILIPLFVMLVFVTPSSIGPFPFWLLVFAVGATANATIPVAVVAAQEYAPGKTATTSALMMGFAWGTAGVLYKLVAEFAELTSITTAMLVTIALLVPAWWLTLKLPEPERARLD